MSWLLDPARLPHGGTPRQGARIAVWFHGSNGPELQPKRPENAAIATMTIGDQRSWRSKGICERGADEAPEEGQ